jgi:tetraacyldisaccharide 4'-kinase
MARNLKLILIPFSFAYQAIVWVRNQLFDKKIFRSATFNFPVICVGNLAVGGTGKTPMVEYLVRLLQKKYKVATLSRGYKRKTKGFAIADENTTAVDIGDEPMQIHIKYPDTTVAVAEERVIGIPQLLYERPETGVIILDDAFQHRAVKAGLNILLTAYNSLYTADRLLPAGTLRDVKSSSRRADIIVVTKCSPEPDEDKRKKILKELGPLPHQKVYFTEIKYGSLYHLFTKETYLVEPDCGVLLVCGIANPAPLESYIKQYTSECNGIQFSDHHIFSSNDLKLIRKEFELLKSEKKIIVTTEKDGVRLNKFKEELAPLPVYVIPMEHRFLFGQEAEFENDINSFTESIGKPDSPE